MDQLEGAGNGVKRAAAVSKEGDPVDPVGGGEACRLRRQRCLWGRCWSDGAAWGPRYRAVSGGGRSCELLKRDTPL